MSSPKTTINEITAVLRPDAVRLTTQTGESKDIGYTDFLQFLQKHVGVLEDDIKSATFKPRLPQSCVWMKVSKSQLDLTLYFNESVETLNFIDRTFEKCVTPNIIVQITMQPSKRGTATQNTGDREAFPTGWFIADARWYCTNKKPEELNFPISGASTDNAVWYLPVGNIYSDGRMCTGQNPYPEVMKNDFRILDTLFLDIFVRGTFNNDLSVNHVSFGIGNRDVLELYSKCHRFPYEILRNYRGPNKRPESMSETIKFQRDELKSIYENKLLEIHDWFIQQRIPAPISASEAGKDLKIGVLENRLRDAEARFAERERQLTETFQAGLAKAKARESAAAAEEESSTPKKARAVRKKKSNSVEVEIEVETSNSTY